MRDFPLNIKPQPMKNNYLKPVPIQDSKLTTDLERTRSGRTQAFKAKGKRSFDPDFTIQPPEKHIYAILIDGKWCWVNGCDLCNNKPKKYQ